MPLLPGPILVQEHAPLWRYVPLHTLFHYLAGKVFIPSIGLLQKGDPTEGLRIVDEVWSMSGFSPDERVSLLDYVFRHLLSDQGRTLWGINGSRANQREAFDHYEKMLEGSRYAWCWFKSLHESAAMWQLYGKGGAAVRTSCSRLGDVLGHDERRWLVSGVEYLDLNTEPEYLVGFGDPSMNPWARRPFLVKRMEYRHEEEVRLVTVSTAGRSGILLEDIPPEKWIEEIVFWPGFPRSEAEALALAVKKMVPELEGKTRVSRLFQRDPKNYSSDFVDGFVDNIAAEAEDQEALKWPSWLHEP
ncbi:MAG TPA: hypothetical protein VMB21_07395 [Candidatus Limnocylindria bacterium]|jgi:hypothetical protein|nr:hypothetical protein [Candidatus Limnocylindria bacterium]